MNPEIFKEEKFKFQPLTPFLPPNARIIDLESCDHFRAFISRSLQACILFCNFGHFAFTIFIYRWLRWTPFFWKNTSQKVEKLMTLSVSHKFCFNYSDLVINANAALTQFVNLPCQRVNRGLFVPLPSWDHRLDDFYWDPVFFFPFFPNYADVVPHKISMKDISHQPVELFLES
ncbi:hypothetical protein GQX74_015213 [Glossina fuscipes]|nr:hypothetical protein GQX74_015213 [Glossina fuscipes]